MKKYLKKIFQKILPKIIKTPKYEINERPAEFSFLFSCLNLNEGRKILDVGTGTAPLAFLLSYCGYDVDAIDLEPNNYFVKVKKEDIASVAKKENGKYDFITCISVLEHIPDFDSAVKNMAECCKTGGVIILTTPWSSKHFVENYLKCMNPNTSKLCHIYSRSNIEKWLQDNSLQIVKEAYFKSGIYSAPQYIPIKPVPASMEEADLVCLAMKKA